MDWLDRPEAIKAIRDLKAHSYPPAFQNRIV